MKALLVNLLITFSLALCAFNAIQWYREAKLHGRIETLGSEIYKKSADIQDLQQNLKVNQEEIKRLDSIRENYNTLVKSNKTVIEELREESARFQQDAKIQGAKAAQLDQYRQAFDKANENLKKQNEIIQVQNEKMKQVADDRNEMVTRYNKLAGDYKGLGDDYQKVLGLYTNLVEQVQAANAKSSK